MNDSHLNFGLEYDMRIPSIRQPKNASKLIDCEIANIPDFELWRFRAHLQLDDLDLVRYDGWFITFIESVVEHVDCICVELGAETRPFERE